MKFMLDTNVILAVVLTKDGPIHRHMAKHEEGDFVMSAITLAEIVHGSHRGKPPEIDRLNEFTDEVLVRPFDARAAHAYATIPFKRHTYDRLIAAHALSLGLTVVTGNGKDFADVPGLKVENWTR